MPEFGTTTVEQEHEQRRRLARERRERRRQAAATRAATTTMVAVPSAPLTPQDEEARRAMYRARALRVWETRRRREAERADRWRRDGRLAGPPEAPDLLGVVEAARLVGYGDPSELRRACQREELPAHRKGRQWFVGTSEVEAWAARRRQRAQTPGLTLLLADLLDVPVETTPTPRDPEAAEALILSLLAESPWTTELAPIMARLYGLNGQERVSQSDLARERGVTRQAINGVRRQSLKRLRQPQAREMIEALLRPEAG